MGSSDRQEEAQATEPGHSPTPTRRTSSCSEGSRLLAGPDSVRWDAGIEATRQGAASEEELVHVIHVFAGSRDWAVHDSHLVRD
jgi:hypothetical protein